MIGSRGWYWIWIGLFVFFVLLNAASGSFLITFKKRNYHELWQEDVERQTLIMPAGTKVFYEINQGMSKWVSIHRHLRIWFSLYKWSKRFAFLVFVGPIASIFCCTF
jgi:hypothetical protein